MNHLRMVGEARFFLASPLIAIAKLSAWIATRVAGEDVICFAMREATQINEDNLAEIAKEINEIDKSEKSD